MAPSIINKILGKTDEKDTSSSDTSNSRGNSSGLGQDSSNARSSAGHSASEAHSSAGQSASRARTSGSGGLSSAENVEYSTSDKTMSPAVTHEHVVNTHQEQVQEVLDRERHQDHYHTTVQPLEDREILPEQHMQRQADTQYQEYNHEDASKTKDRLAAEQAQFQNTRTETTSQGSTSQGPTRTSESVHHHLHETVQPVIEKETIQPTVMHTTVPIKEVHKDAAHFHGTSTAPAMSVDEFQRGGNASTGTGSGNISSEAQGGPRGGY